MFGEGSRFIMFSHGHHIFTKCTCAFIHLTDTSKSLSGENNALEEPRTTLVNTAWSCPLGIHGLMAGGGGDK
jgi:hypothetical protein